MKNNGASPYKQLLLTDAVSNLDKELEKLLATALKDDGNYYQEQFHRFKALFMRYVQCKGSEIDWSKIVPINDDKLLRFDEMIDAKLELRKAYLDKLIVVKLNGGLGTSMGCVGPKSLIVVRNDLTFLEHTIRQIERLNATYATDIPLVLMNSFNTDEETKKVLNKYGYMNVRIYSFVQSKFPRLNRESLLPMATKLTSLDEEEGSWYPPGHGDFYRSFYRSGYLDKFINEGREWAFISNIDNLGAEVHTGILSTLSSSNNEFVMEVTEKNRSDVKGGTLVDYDGRLRLLEIAQVPKAYVDDFTSVRKFRTFNTNNIWIKLEAMKRAITNDDIRMELIENPKTLDSGLNVIQLEEAVGAAIQAFKGAAGLKVPRSRFLPVKTTSDLLLVMSNLYTFDHGQLVISPLRNFPSIPLVKLGTQFKSVQAFLTRFPDIPNILELDHLTVSGDVTFGKGVTLKGTVIIIANHGDRIDVPRGSVLDNKIVSGNLRILDH